MTTQINLRFM